MKKRIVSILMALCLCLTLLPTAALAEGEVTPDYSWYNDDQMQGDEGSKYYVISDAADLLGFANLVNGADDKTATDFAGKTVKLGADIDLSGIANWTPIGKNSALFKGTFDGQNHKISGLTVNSTGQYDYVGLFGKVFNATVQNLAVSGSVTGTGTYSSVGGIIGNLGSGGSIENCSFSGSVTGDGIYVGGIAGDTSSTISKCSNTATVSGSAFSLGGIAGGSQADIQYCCNQGKISSTRTDNSYVRVGGIVGYVRGNSSIEVRSCYNTGATTAAAGNAAYARIGGIVGNVDDQATLAVTNAYYLNSSVQNGIGSVLGSVSGRAVGKDATAFSSGEVAWLLQNAVAEADGQVWGQRIGTDDYPVFATADGSNKVYKVTFKVDGEDDQEKYVNSDLNGAPTPTAPTGYAFGGWYTEAEGGTKVTAITADTTLYARWADEADEPEAPGFVWLIPGGLAGATDLTDTTFGDVSRGAYYYNAVEWAAERGIAGGVDSKHFAPDESCTRAQAVTMLWRAAGCPDIWGESPFVDVSAENYYYEAVLWAVANGITSGTDATHFSPDAPCTRGQIVTFLHRAARCYVAHERFGFADVKPGSYCEDAVNWAVENAITNGTSEGTFSPDSVCTRAQIVTFLYRNR